MLQMQFKIKVKSIKVRKVLKTFIQKQEKMK